MLNVCSLDLSASPRRGARRRFWGSFVASCPFSLSPQNWGTVIGLHPNTAFFAHLSRRHRRQCASPPGVSIVSFLYVGAPEVLHDVRASRHLPNEISSSTGNAQQPIKQQGVGFGWHFVTVGFTPSACSSTRSCRSRCGVRGVVVSMERRVNFIQIHSVRFA